MGWIRALKGHIEDLSDTKYKEGDEERFVIQAQTTDKLVVFGTNGKFYTIQCDKIPRGKGHGDPIRLLIDLENDQDVVNAFVYEPAKKYLVAILS